MVRIAYNSSIPSIDRLRNAVISVVSRLVSRRCPRSSARVFSTYDNPSTNVTFPIQKAGEYIDVMLKVFDNESTRRKELFHAGVSYDEFNYDFDPSDGSTYVKLRIHVRYHTDPPPPPPRNYWPFVFLCALVVVLYLGFILAAQRQRLARARRERRK